MAAKDHTVPQLYLRRFAENRKASSKGFYTDAARADDLSKIFSTEVRNVASLDGFYTQTDDDGTEDRSLDIFLSRVEDLAVPAFTQLLDSGRWAFPYPWPGFKETDRLRLSWFIAAQMLRTTRQRKRLAALRSADSLDLPTSLRNIQIANDHAQFIADQVSQLAYIIFHRPWGIGMSVACLLTSDTPVVILNDHDADDQLAAASFWEILMPLDPHRFFYLPSASMVQEDPAKRDDHRLVLQNGMGYAVNQAVFDAADSYVFWHPRHRPRSMPRPLGRLPAPESEDAWQKSEWYFPYSVMKATDSIERKYVNQHPPTKS
ncbi:MAG: hypothetical protein JWM55_603 [Acidimicrobiaceae bacterium]|nr:hypothetical protein [Acidimicrobiaceae bacterium]